MASLLILSDIHANLEALRAVLDHAQRHGRPDEIWCLGDLVGYGPDPGACLDVLRGDHPLTQSVPVRCVMGNHDLGTLRQGQGHKDETTSESVRDSWAWSFQVLSDDQRGYLAGLPRQAVVADLPQAALLVHAAPPDDLNKYLRIPADIESCLSAASQPLCFFGHTHLAAYFECDLARHEAKPRLFSSLSGEPVTVRGDKIFLNPGSVGQPRWGRFVPKQADTVSNSPFAYQGVTEATYLWVDLQVDRCRVSCHYVSYPYEHTIAKLRRLATQEPRLIVPERWIARLHLGLR